MTNCHHLLLAYTPHLELSLLITMNLHAVTTLTFDRCAFLLNTGAVVLLEALCSHIQGHLYNSAMSIQATEFKGNTQFYP